MAKKRRLNPQSVWDAAALEAAFADAGVKPSHVQALYRYLLKHQDAGWADVPDLPKAAIELLSRDFVKCTSRVVHCQHSEDGETSKLLLELQDGLQVEAVIMRYDTTGAARGQDGGASDSGTGQQRATLCVSSEVGCQMGCTFCATGTMGLKGDLTAGEIVEQLWHARGVTSIRNVVFMGMGEPLNNYEAVRTAVAMMTDSALFALRRSSVTVSTVGVVPRILQLADDLPGVSLALSLHAPDQELRRSIVPSAAVYKLDRLMAAVATYQQKTQQKVFVEYVMLAGVNDGEQQAQQLGALLRGRDVVVNLIPWNPVFSPGIAFAAPDPDRVKRFHSVLRSEYGLPCTVRQEKGQDISGACGQLVVEQRSAGNRTNATPNSADGTSRAVRDIEELLPRLAVSTA